MYILYRLRQLNLALIVCCLLAACGPSEDVLSPVGDIPSVTDLPAGKTTDDADRSDTEETDQSNDNTEEMVENEDTLENYIANIPSSLYAGELTKQKIQALLSTGEWTDMCEKGSESFLTYTNIYLSGPADYPNTSRYRGFIYDKDNHYGRTHDLIIYCRTETDPVTDAPAGSIELIYLQETDSWDYILLYSEDGYTPTPTEFNVYIRKLYGLTDYIRCDLPKGYTANNHWNADNFWNGWLLEGDEKEDVYTLAMYTSWENCVAGGIGFFDNTDTSIVEFRKNKISNIHFGDETAFPGEEWTPVEGCYLPAILVEYDFLLFTDSEVWDLYHSRNPETAWEDVGWSSYWYLFMAAPDVDTGYVVFLNKKYFTKEDILALARSIAPKDALYTSPASAL